jgi:hypothetical protein
VGSADLQPQRGKHDDNHIVGLAIKATRGSPLYDVSPVVFPDILLSFAQFEREVIGERIRDKVAASRKRGMWMGGYVPLGYDVRDSGTMTTSAALRDC